MPIFLSKMIINLLKENKSTISVSRIKCYFNFIFLFTKLSEINKTEFNKYVSDILRNVKKTQAISGYWEFFNGDSFFKFYIR